MSSALNPLTFPLQGSHLIEASAGTGKTFTLAALYLRLVMGHGGDNGFRGPLLPPDILVVTFTEAATRELRDRIRQRLAQAAQLFAGLETEADAFLLALKDDVPPAQWPEQAARLRAAAQWMDDAAIYTIHGFCQRMLRQHAFDSGSLFTLELAPDEEKLLVTATDDYWRTFCLSLDATQAGWLAQVFASPEALLKAVRPLLSSCGHLAATPASFPDLLDTWVEERAQASLALKQRWQQWASELLPLFEAAWDDARLPRGKPSKSASISGWLKGIVAWCDDANDMSRPKAITDTSLRCFTRAALGKVGTDIDAILAHPAIDRFDELKNPGKALPDLGPRLLPHACHWIAARLASSKHQQALIGYDDMLQHLHDALHGSQAEALAGQVRQQYPFALIDEFQDTDPVQYQIFERIYAGTTDTGWLMIGDPKQAIYSFRGADIHTYLAARRDTRGHHHTLTTNYRSAAPLVAAINHVFSNAESKPQGAFRLGSDVPFHAVAANGRAETFVIEDAAVSPLTFWHLKKPADDKDTTFSKSAYISTMATACAAQIAALLEQSQHGDTGFRRDGTVTPVRPADIAILVRDRTEADSIRSALRKLDLASVYLSDRDNVFASAEAQDLLAWLAACAEPASEARVRLALATATLGQDWDTLHALVSDEGFWEDTAERFAGYQRQWQLRGVLAMLRQILRDFDVPARLLARSDGERILTNVLHMGELLQHAAGQLDGEQALVRWLVEMIETSDSNNTADENILRLESDAGLIKVITMHKSKGLEYPLVFIPFACAFKPVDPDRPPLRYHDDSGQLVVTLAPDEAETQRADSERLAEDLRLMYVAMTRARHACWLGIAATRLGNRQGVCELHRSAIGDLLGATSATGAGDVAGLLAQLAHPGISICDAPDGGDARPVPAPATASLAAARTFTGQAGTHWWIASYSALTRADSRDAPDDVTADIVREESSRQARQPQPAGDSAHAFPRGPLPGTFLHELLEWGADNGFARCHADDEDWQKMLATRCHGRRWDQWQGTLCHWLQSVTHTPLAVQDTTLTLSALDRRCYQAEMEFWLPSHHVAVEELDRLVCEHTLGGARRAPLQAPQLNGMLKGFIDLVLEHDGRFYVLDYKSNWLGPDDHSYAPPALAHAILEGRYDMQYCLYLLALHRLLRARLGERYDYDTHIGGSLYLFLRGIGDDSGGLFHERPDKALIEAMDHLFREGHA
ncbi:MAG: exodeoxyribonuclease V subunit beta [Alcanivoracaceae bacterium]|nr:exodeoxyribonuclease V subunit beta [Alcanivoracaceae bacterium]